MKVLLIISIAIIHPIPANSLLQNNSKIFSQNIVDDKTNWTEIKGSFITDSDYQFLLLGNYFEDQNTLTFNCVTHSYYFFDSICLSPDPMFCEQLFNSNAPEMAENQNYFSIFPNPTLGIITISTHSNFIASEIILIDITGRNIFQQKLITNTSRIDINSIPSGLYFYEVRNVKAVKSYGRILKL